MNLFAVVALISAISCKENDHTTDIKLDKDNMIVAQEEGPGEAVEVKKPMMKAADYPKIEIENPDFDFGTINQGDKVSHVFKFTNTGKNDLIIINAQATCGCTIPEWTKTPIKAGENGEVKIIFNSEGKVGLQEKTVTLTTNTLLGNEKINFKAIVTPKTK